MSEIVARNYSNATFIYDRKLNKSIFFEGELAGEAFNYFNDSKYEISDNFFENYSEDDKALIKEDYQTIKYAVDDFTSEDNNLDEKISNKEHDNDNSLKRFVKYAQTNSQTINASIELTSNCNLRCELCYLDNFEEKGLSIEKLKDVAYQLKENGVLFISFTGGEIFTRKDTIELIRFYYDLGFVIEIKSNALLLNENLIEQLGKIYILDFQISIYEVDNMNSTYTNSHYNFTKLKNNLCDLVQHNIPLTLSVLVGKHNINNIDIIHENLVQLGISDIFYSPYITPNRKMLGKEKEFRLSYEELEKSFKPFVNNIDGFSEVEKYRSCSSSNIICYAGRDQIAISSNGNVYPCLDLNISLGSIVNESLYEILQKRFSTLDKYKMQHMEKCIVCDIRDYCDSCIGIAIMENQNYKEPVSHKCDISRFYYSNTKD